LWQCLTLATVVTVGSADLPLLDVFEDKAAAVAEGDSRLWFLFSSEVVQNVPGAVSAQLKTHIEICEETEPLLT